STTEASLLKVRSMSCRAVTMRQISRRFLSRLQEKNNVFSQRNDCLSKRADGFPEGPADDQVHDHSPYFYISPGDARHELCELSLYQPGAARDTPHNDRWR